MGLRFFAWLMGLLFIDEAIALAVMLTGHLMPADFSPPFSMPITLMPMLRQLSRLFRVALIITLADTPCFDAFFFSMLIFSCFR